MHVVGRADDDGIQVTLLQQPAEIVVSFGGRIFLRGGPQVKVINVAKGDDILASHSAEVVGTAVGDADDAEIEFFVGAYFSAGTSAAGARTLLLPVRGSSA